MHTNDAIALTVQVVSAHLQTTPARADDLPAIMRRIHAAILSLADVQPEEPEPFVPPHPAAAADFPPEERAAAITTDKHLICLECGAHVMLMKPHLRDRHQLSPEAYINKWGLPDDYPMTPQSFRDRKRAIALERDLGATGRARKAQYRAERIRQNLKNDPTPQPPRPAKRGRGRPRKVSYPQ